MPASKVVLLACGSYNPPTNMHLRMFEIARDHLHRLGNHIVVGGLVSPVHDAYGKNDLVSATHRLAMIKLALQTDDWIRVSDWECKQESWTRTRKILQYHQNLINSIVNSSNNDYNHLNEDDLLWLPDNIRNGCSGPVQVKLLCGADLLESFGTPGLWSDEDIEAIVGQHGLVVVTRDKSDPLKFIYDSDLLTKFMGNIIIVTEWIRNEVSSTKIRRALRRSESVKYLIPDKVIEYIHRHGLFGSKDIKYLFPPMQYNSNFLTPSPSDATMESPSPTHNNPCFNVCNNNLLPNYNCQIMPIDTVDNVSKTNTLNNMSKHPGQAIKIITESTGEHKIIKENKKNMKEASIKRPACLL
ncbi:hypothetical protein ILUMI_01082 [Ignelater luminosus]|uniref:Nicotinamide-nucleotide adenylyltransferase n=1 Tax=Ignelater luminosus TaxID=2038154 RepID=A0A8K0GPK4_IGNLU|nr:hypothetical protein ILUMI_01082 [Ignelater luminosus]